jgi:catechol 2,3-dioxygenase-like lactoylglutathione lyase family enzyme
LRSKSKILSVPLPFTATFSDYRSIRADRSKRGFCIGAQRLALFTCECPGSGEHFAFLIPPEKAEQARSALVARGFPEETMQQDDGFSVYVRDPDGNKIELYGKRTTGA